MDELECAIEVISASPREPLILRVQRRRLKQHGKSQSLFALWSLQKQKASPVGGEICSM